MADRDELVAEAKKRGLIPVSTAEFPPEWGAYDEGMAAKYGMLVSPEQKAQGVHGQSRVPKGPDEGLYLKAENHPTFHMAVEADLGMGGKIYRNKKNGRIYSFESGRDTGPDFEEQKWEGSGEFGKLIPKHWMDKIPRINKHARQDAALTQQAQARGQLDEYLGGVTAETPYEDPAGKARGTLNRPLPGPQSAFAQPDLTAPPPMTTVSQEIAKEHEQGNVEESWIQPAMVAGAAGGAGTKIALAAGKKFLPAFMQGIASMVPAGTMEFPIGQIADMAAESDNPQLALLLSVGLGFGSGLTVERLAERGLLKAVNGSISRYPKVADRVLGSDVAKTLRSQTGTYGPQFKGETPAKKAPTFYSQVEEVAEKKLPGKMSGKSGKGHIDAMLRKGEVKQEEVDTLGVREWLDEQGDKKITKQDAMDFIRANRLELEETVKAADKQRLPGSIEDYEVGLSFEDPMTYEVRGPSGDRVFEHPNEREAHEWLDDQFNLAATKFSSYTLPGGENYREVLLRMPTAKDPMAEARRIAGEDAWSRMHPNMQQQLADSATNPARRGAFTGGHWDEPNVLAHVRVNDRTDADGKKVLFLEEIQSDWHQMGKKQGYAGEDWTLPEPYKLRQEGNEYWVEGEDGTRQTGLYNNREHAIIDIRQQMGLPGKQGGVPDAPFKKTWPMLAMKRMLREAAEKGYDRISWTTGAQQAERYDLSTKVSEIVWGNKKGDDYRTVTIVPQPSGSIPERHGQNISMIVGHDGIVQKSKGNDFAGKPLDEVIGKELADKIMSEQSEYGTLSGLDLKVGGEGMKRFYDDQLVRAVNKYVKKWGGKVGKGEIETGKKAGKDTFEIARDQNRLGTDEEYQVIRYKDSHGLNGTEEGAFRTMEEAEAHVSQLAAVPVVAPAHALDITPEMRAAVLGKGQPMFSVMGAQAGIEEDESGGLTFDPEKAILGMLAAGIAKRVVSGRGKGKFLRAEGRLKGKNPIKSIYPKLVKATRLKSWDDAAKTKGPWILEEWDGVRSPQEAVAFAKSMKFIDPVVVDQRQSLRYKMNKQTHAYGNEKMAHPNESFPEGRNTWDFQGCGREQFALKNGLIGEGRYGRGCGACYGGACYAESITQLYGGKEASIAGGRKVAGITGKLRDEVLGHAKEHGVESARERWPDLVIRKYEDTGKITAKKVTDTGGARVTTKLQPAKGQDIRLGVDTDGSAWLSRPDVMDAILKADPRTLTVYSAGYHTPPPPHPLSERTMVNVTVSGWHPLPETLKRLEWATKARDNGWNVILREVVANPKQFANEEVSLYNRVHDLLQDTDFFVMQQPLHKGSSHSEPMWDMPSCCWAKGKPHTCDQCEVAEGVGRGFRDYWGIKEEPAKGEQTFKTPSLQGFFQGQ